MGKSTLKYISVVFFFFSSMFIWGQGPVKSTLSFTLNKVTLFDIEPVTSNIKLNFNPALEAGNPITPGKIDASIWINYSVAIARGEEPKNISVQMDNLIPGVDIILQAQEASLTTGGTLGKPVPQVVIGMAPVIVISGIGGAFTGVGVNNGHRLDYSLKVNDYSKLVKNPNKVVTITYTISN